MLEFLKNYYVVMLVLMVFSYLVPKEEYRGYIQFFISVFMIVILLRPLLDIFISNDTNRFYEMFEYTRVEIENLDFEMKKGEDIFEYFFSDGKEQ